METISAALFEVKKQYTKLKPMLALMLKFMNIKVALRGLKLQMVVVQICCEDKTTSTGILQFLHFTIIGS